MHVQLTTAEGTFKSDEYSMTEVMNRAGSAKVFQDSCIAYFTHIHNANKFEWFDLIVDGIPVRFMTRDIVHMEFIV